MRALRSRRPHIAGVLLLLYLPACHSWHVGTPTPAEFVETERPESIRVTLADSSTYQMRDPVVQGDSLVGLVADAQDTTRTVSLALSDISRVAVKRTSTSKTLLLVGGIAVVVVGVGYLVAVLAVCASTDYPC